MPDALRATREHLSSSISRAGAVREPARRFGAALISRPKNRKGAKISAPNMRVSRPWEKSGSQEPCLYERSAVVSSSHAAGQLQDVSPFSRAASSHERSSS